MKNQLRDCSLNKLSLICRSHILANATGYLVTVPPGFILGPLEIDETISFIKITIATGNLGCSYKSCYCEAPCEGKFKKIDEIWKDLDKTKRIRPTGTFSDHPFRS